MRVRWGPPPDLDVAPEVGGNWQTMNEPTPNQFVAIGSALGIGLFFGLFMLYRVTFGLDPISFLHLTVGVALVLTPVAHELSHAAALPGGLHSSATIIGFWPQKVLLYVTYVSPLPRHRLLASALAPLVLWSLLPAAAFSVVQWPWLAAVSLLNGAMAGGDVFYAVLLARRVPRGSVVQLKGWRTLWQDANLGRGLTGT